MALAMYELSYTRAMITAFNGDLQDVEYDTMPFLDCKCQELVSMYPPSPQLRNTWSDKDVTIQSL